MIFWRWENPEAIIQPQSKDCGLIKVYVSSKTRNASLPSKLKIPFGNWKQCTQIETWKTVDLFRRKDDRDSPQLKIVAVALLTSRPQQEQNQTSLSRTQA